MLGATIEFGLNDFLLLPASFALLIFALAVDRSPLSRLLACKPLLWLGEISYSLYMVHYFVKDWLKFAGADQPSPALFSLYLTLVMAAGLAVHLLIEKPGRQFFRAAALRKV